MQSELSSLLDSTIALNEKQGTLICTMMRNQFFKRIRKSFLQTSRLKYFLARSSFSSTIKENSSKQSFSIVQPRRIFKRNLICHGGIARVSNNETTEQFLCRPSYLGRQCQWQNQRMSLILQMIHGIIPTFTSVFQLVIEMIDENGQIQLSHEQITYIPKHDCTAKFNVYLLYPDRRKSIASNYSIRIDLDKQKLQYWASWYLSIPFQFLPINRISTQLFIPKIQQKQHCPLFCGNHGRCIFYVNKKFSYFCQYLKHSICRSSNHSCENNGLCIP